MAHPNSFGAKQILTISGKDYVYYSLVEAEKNGLKGATQLPISLKVVLENLLRYEDGKSVTKEMIEETVKWIDCLLYTSDAADD